MEERTKTVAAITILVGIVVLIVVVVGIILSVYLRPKAHQYLKWR